MNNEVWIHFFFSLKTDFNLNLCSPDVGRQSRCSESFVSSCCDDWEREDAEDPVIKLDTGGVLSDVPQDWTEDQEILGYPLVCELGKTVVHQTSVQTSYKCSCNCKIYSMLIQKKVWWNHLIQEWGTREPCWRWPSSSAEPWLESPCWGQSWMMGTISPWRSRREHCRGPPQSWGALPTCTETLEEHHWDPEKIFHCLTMIK